MKRLAARNWLRCLVVALAAWVSADAAHAGDWLTWPSTYTHSPVTGERVNQYAQVEAPLQPDSSTLVVSGYTHYRSTIQYGQSADNYHRVDQWGPPVRPYGEWQFPYRPYSVPYSAWGAPFAGLGFGGPLPPYGYPGGGGGYPGGGGGYPGGGIPGQPNPYPTDAQGPYPVPPWYDGYHPDYPVTPPLSDKDFFAAPRQPRP
ncbi:MAG: hypothetical protein ACO1RT_02300 [Planctomycetaceae bacterium]